MRKLLFLAGAAAALLTIAPEPADAQGRRGVYRGGVYRGGPAVRYGYRRPGYVYRRGYGWGPAAVGLGVLGAAAVGAAAAGAYADPCLRQQQVYDVYGNV